MLTRIEVWLGRLGVGEVNLGPEGATGRIQGPRRSCHFGGNPIIAEGLDPDAGFRTDLNIICIAFRNVDEDSHDVNAVDDVNGQLAFEPGERYAAPLHRRRVTGKGEHEISRVGISGDDDPVKRSREREVADPGFEAPGFALGDGKIGASDSHVDIGPGEGGFLGEQFGLSRADAGIRRVARGATRL